MGEYPVTFCETEEKRLKGKHQARRLKKFLASRKAALLGNLLLIIIFATAAVFMDEYVQRTSGLLRAYLSVISKSFENGIAISVIIVDIVVMIVKYLYNGIDSKLEEEEKTSADHHALIWKYGKYKTNQDKLIENYWHTSGERILYLKWPDNKKGTENELRKQYIKNVGKENYNEKIDESIKKYIENGIVELPEAYLFVNIEGNVDIVFKDSTEETELPDFIESNAVAIMDAHKTSKTENKSTVRLSGLKYNEDKKKLSLITTRTNYYHMLLTNRCMDFRLANGLSIRELYEYRKYVLPLNETKLSNQIGVEGLIITNDGFTLIEKRGHGQRTTWRDKFAQPISLSMSCDDLGIKDNSYTLGSKPADAEEAITGMLKKHLEGFGLLLGIDYKFNISENFLGISRDLIEGGKPNIYFYIVVDMNRYELKERLENQAKIPYGEKNGYVKDENLGRKYYLYRLKDISVNFNYVMEMDMREGSAERIYRRRDYSAPEDAKLLEKVEGKIKNIIPYLTCCVNKSKMEWRRFVKSAFNISYKKECGEALLGCLGFYNICHRVDDDWKDPKHKLKGVENG